MSTTDSVQPGHTVIPRLGRASASPSIPRDFRLAVARARSHVGRFTTAPAIDERRRTRLTVTLGLFWLLDAGLQFQPYLYSAAFPDSIRAAGSGSPAWISGPDRWAAHLVATNVAVWNTLFAVTQLALGVGLLTRRYRTPALAASICWAVLVWWLGEGLGTILAGPADALTGFPGAVVLYAIIAAALWPPRAPRRHRKPSTGRSSVPAENTWGPAIWSTGWVLLWGGMIFETQRPAERDLHLLPAELSMQATNEPGWLRQLDHMSARFASGHPAAVSVTLTTAFALIAALVLVRSPRARAVGVWLTVTWAILMWGVGQNFGAILSGHATDPNSGPLLALLALCFLPPAPVERHTRQSGQKSTNHRHTADTALETSTRGRRTKSR